MHKCDVLCTLAWQKRSSQHLFKKRLVSSENMTFTQVSDSSEQSRLRHFPRRLLSSKYDAVRSLHPSHCVSCSVESGPAGGGAAEEVLLQQHLDAGGDRPGVWCSDGGPASTQSTDPRGVCDSASSACPRTHTVQGGGALQEEEQAQNHAVHSGLQTTWGFFWLAVLFVYIFVSLTTHQLVWFSVLFKKIRNVDKRRTKVKVSTLRIISSR